MMPYGDVDLGQHWLVIGWHQAITWTNVDFSLVRFCGKHSQLFHCESPGYCTL